VRIGLDFDNTLVCYDRLFLKLGHERGLLPQGFPADKTAVRDFLRRTGREEDWTEMQGLAYGPRITEAELFPGAREFVCSAVGAGWGLFVVSHKTPHPLLGPAFDLHTAARSFLRSAGVVGPGGLAEGAVFLEPTKEGKARRLTQLELDAFVDDLPEFLDHPLFPSDVRRLLFCPSGSAVEGPWELTRSWEQVGFRLALGAHRS